MLPSIKIPYRSFFSVSNMQSMKNNYWRNCETDRLEITYASYTLSINHLLGDGKDKKE